jgi:hypothetical protein
MKTSQKNTKLTTTIKAVPLSIFKKFINKNSKLIPFNVKINYRGETKYFPPFSKE